MLVVKPNDNRALSSAHAVAEELVQVHQLRVLVEPRVQAETGGFGGITTTWLPEETSQLHRRVDFVVTLGGDGTILWASGLFQSAMPPLLAFALGSLGFLTPFPMEDHRRTLAMMTLGEFQVTLRARLICRVIRAGEAEALDCVGDSAGSFCTTTVLNEVVVDRGPSHSLVELECFCDGAFMTRISADGIIVATPTGSTAYSLAAGGSMVHPGISSLLFTPVNAHALSSRPLLLPDGVELRIRVSPTARCTAFAAFDGRQRHELARGDTLVVRVSPFPLPSVSAGGSNDDFFRAANSGLFWNMRGGNAGPGVRS
jgi:NAD+ kinase